MKLLHILRSQPCELARQLMAKMSPQAGAREVALYVGAVDYARLVEDIFASDLVICWW